MKTADTGSAAVDAAIDAVAAVGEPAVEPVVRWLDVCALEDIEPLGARVLRRAAGADVAIFRNASDGVFALLDRCPHKGGPLSQGIVFEDRVACPLHDWQIRLADGEAIEPDRGCVHRFRVRVVAGRVQLDAAQFGPADGAARIVA